MIEMHPSVGRIVTGNRADEMVLAGAAPTASFVGDPIAHVHRGTSFILLVDGAIVVFIFAQIFMSLGLLSGPLGTGVVGGVTFAGLMVYGGYRNRKAWAYWPAVSILVLASIIFAVNALVSLYMLVMGGYLSNILFVVLFSWAAMGSGRRALFHWHPGYRTGYHNTDFTGSFNLGEGEMLAACPSCLAVLAIRPAMLGKADRCPHCGNGLVSQELLARHSDEES
jgi:hypothetical protein